MPRRYQAVFFALFSTLFSAALVSAESKCPGYCNANGYYEPEVTCQPSYFCCGTDQDRYCCDDPNEDISDRPGDDSCRTSWWYFQWRVIVGLLVTLIGLLVVAACCYYCCGDPQSPRQIWRRNRRNRRAGGNDTEISTVTGNVGGDTPAAPDGPPLPTFDPDSPYAFMPPSYESLPKDPPKYCEIYDNPAFETIGEEAEPTYEAIGEASSNTAGPVDQTGGGNAPDGTANSRQQTTAAPNSPPPIYDVGSMPTVSVNDQGRLATDVTLGNVEAPVAPSDESSLGGSSAIIVVGSNSNSDVESETEADTISNNSNSTLQGRSQPRGEPRLGDDTDAVCNPLYRRDSRM